jgi:hypothetical protein
MAYGRYGARRGQAVTTGRVARVNARPGPCHYCGVTVAAGEGQLWRDAAGWAAVHLAAGWSGSPVSGRWIGGCPDGSAADRETAGRDSRGGYADECGSCGMASCACG